MKPNTKAIIKFLQSNKGVNFTSTDVATALGLDVKVVNGTFTGAIQRKGLGVRVPATIEVEGVAKEVKYLQLTDEGLALDVDAIETVDAK